MVNLWPESLSLSERLPYSVLFSQAEFFNRLYFGSRAESDGNPTENKATLIIRNKKHEQVLLEIHHANSYPCEVFWDGMARSALTQAALIGILAEIFHSQYASNILREFNQ